MISRKHTVQIGCTAPFHLFLDVRAVLSTTLCESVRILVDILDPAILYCRFITINV